MSEFDEHLSGLALVFAASASNGIIHNVVEDGGEIHGHSVLHFVFGS